MKFRIIYLFAIFIVSVFAQKSLSQNQFLSTKDSDKNAIALWKKSKNIFESAKTVALTYKMTNYLPETKPVIFNGIAKQKGQQFYVEVGDKYYYCDGKSLVVLNRTQKIAQINSLDSKSNAITPSMIMKHFDPSRFVYMQEMSAKPNEKTKKVVLKPVEKRSEYTKVEFLIDAKTNMLVEVRMFNKDGSRTFIEINNVKLNQNIDNNVFIFNKADHPGVSVEDLRMD